MTLSQESPTAAVAGHDRAVAASAAGYAACMSGAPMDCPPLFGSPLERRWWIRGWLARLGEDPTPD